jgi:N,N'-diacetyllegionaminate synthase
MPSTLIIAEAGVNHNGDINLARQLIDAASDAGANIVKFQTFKADQLATHFAPKAKYQQKESDKDGNQLEMLRKLELSQEMHYQLIEHCKARKIGFLSTGFDIESLEFLLGLGLDIIKIPSGEITNLPILRYIAKKGKQLIISTGMSTVEEIQDCLIAMYEAGASKEKITLLHCNTAYPTPYDDVNLRAITTLQRRFELPVGYSDHTLGIEVPIAAVSLGATVIEKHFTLDRCLPGPDHKASLEPKELSEMVRSIRIIESALGKENKTPTASEEPNKVIARKSIVAAGPIKAGERFSETNMTTKRPGNGISPMRWDSVLGQIAKRDFEANELIEL